ncbi:TPA: hypothetical protein JD336_02945 [Serratia marcescens]|nr:hypothetical protein [Serratia marcescens]
MGRPDFKSGWGRQRSWAGSTPVIFRQITVSLTFLNSTKSYPSESACRHFFGKITVVRVMSFDVVLWHTERITAL